MKNPALVKKYARAFAQAVADEREFAAVGADVRAFLEAFEAHAALQRAVVSPFVNARKRQAVLGEVLARLGTGPKAGRFLRLLQRHKRLGLLPEIVDALPEAWSERLGAVTYEVASAVPLTEAQRGRLARGLEASERRPVRLVPRIDPALLGGLALRKGHIVYDASVEGTLAALRERLGRGTQRSS
ncbi:MAG TPA: ATP synthase F1 subunit delta [Candidatus Aminicenantes bacterium]|nr:ATP synthase F1 subunit delta [Candidatus Aminicenantes bacterium]